MDPDPDQKIANQNPVAVEKAPINGARVALFVCPPMRASLSQIHRLQEALEPSETILPTPALTEVLPESLVVPAGSAETQWAWVKKALRVVDPQTEAFIFVSSEHQTMKPDYLRRLVEEWQNHSWACLAVASFKGHRGGPVLISSLLRREILSMRVGDLSFHKLLVKYPQQTLEVHVDEPFQTLDPVEKYQEFLESSSTPFLAEPVASKE